MCVRATFWDRLTFPQILVVFKSPTTKINFVDFLQIQAAFWKTNYTTFSYLLMPVYGQDMSENEFLTVAAKFWKIFAPKSLPSNKAPGCDKVNSKILKDSSPVIAPIITSLINNSFTLSTFPLPILLPQVCNFVENVLGTFFDKAFQCAWGDRNATWLSFINKCR